MRSSPASLHLVLKKISADRSALSCRRADGTVTWARTAPFFPAHDLTHFAVESVLAWPRGFFGLIAEGWQLGAFAEPGVAARLPRESLVAENLVGHIERLGDETTVGDFNSALAASLVAQDLPPFRALTAAELTCIRTTRSALLARWKALPMGETLELDFPAEAATRG